jgi:hypothetical protein
MTYTTAYPYDALTLKNKAASVRHYLSLGPQWTIEKSALHAEVPSSHLAQVLDAIQQLGTTPETRLADEVVALRAQVSELTNGSTSEAPEAPQSVECPPSVSVPGSPESEAVATDEPFNSESFNGGAAPGGAAPDLSVDLARVEANLGAQMARIESSLLSVIALIEKPSKPAKPAGPDGRKAPWSDERKARAKASARARWARRRSEATEATEATVEAAPVD